MKRKGPWAPECLWITAALLTTQDHYVKEKPCFLNDSTVAAFYYYSSEKTEGGQHR